MVCFAVENCGEPITDSIWGSIGFEHNLVMENNQKDGEAHTKHNHYNLLNMTMMDMLKELAKTQLKCKKCHIKVIAESYDNHRS